MFCLTGKSSFCTPVFFTIFTIFTFFGIDFRQFHFFIEVALDVFDALTDYVIHIDKRRLTQPDIHKSGLHPGQNPLYFAFVDVAGTVGAVFSFNEKLRDGAIFQQRHTRLMLGCIDYNLFIHVPPTL